MRTARSPKKANYRDVKAEILHRITEGDWAPGTLLPGEIELAESFGVARATVNRAMRELAEEGLLERRRKAGTRVRPSPLRSARFEIPLIREEIEGTGAVYCYTLLERSVQKAPAWLRDVLGLQGNARVLHLACQHTADGRPYQFEDRWINLDALPDAADADFGKTGPNEWLVKAIPFSEVEISFLASAADERLAGQLGMSPGEPVFTVERTTWWAGKPITHVRLHFARGHRMTTRY